MVMCREVGAVYPDHQHILGEDVFVGVVMMMMMMMLMMMIMTMTKKTTTTMTMTIFMIMCREVGAVYPDHQHIPGEDVSVGVVLALDLTHSHSRQLLLLVYEGVEFCLQFFFFFFCY
jgi:ABC-type ATPase involved in cell division